MITVFLAEMWMRQYTKNTLEEKQPRRIFFFLFFLYLVSLHPLSLPLFHFSSSNSGISLCAFAALEKKIVCIEIVWNISSDVVLTTFFFPNRRKAMLLNWIYAHCKCKTNTHTLKKSQRIYQIRWSLWNYTMREEKSNNNNKRRERRTKIVLHNIHIYPPSIWWICLFEHTKIMLSFAALPFSFLTVCISNFSHCSHFIFATVHTKHTRDLTIHTHTHTCMPSI